MRVLGCPGNVVVHDMDEVGCISLDECLMQCAQTNYYMIDAGACTIPITDVTTCNAAASELGLKSVSASAYVDTSGIPPPGCYYDTDGFYG